MIISENGDFVEITKTLKKLRRLDKTSLTARTTIMGYELGSIQEYAIRKVQKDFDPNVLKVLEENAKLGMADLITTCRMFSLDCGWDFDEIQKLGLEHIQERFKDFQKEGFAGDRL